MFIYFHLHTVATQHIFFTTNDLKEKKAREVFIFLQIHNPNYWFLYVGCRSPYNSELPFTSKKISRRVTKRRLSTLQVKCNMPQYLGFAFSVSSD